MMCAGLDLTGKHAAAFAEAFSETCSTRGYVHSPPWAGARTTATSCSVSAASLIFPSCLPDARQPPRQPRAFDLHIYLPRARRARHASYTPKAYVTKLGQGKCAMAVFRARWQGSEWSLLGATWGSRGS